MVSLKSFSRLNPQAQLKKRLRFENWISVVSMRKRRLCFDLLLSLVFVMSAIAQTETILGSISIPNPDGPYIFYTPQGVRVISVNENGMVTQKLFPGSVLPPGTSFEVTSQAKDITTGARSHFNVTLQSEMHRPSGVRPSPERLIVLSDVHAKWTPFVSILKKQGVVDSDLKWAFGTDELMIIGDIADRGVDATACYWLVYELQRQARLAGGEVYFNLGNHEDMRINNIGMQYMDYKYELLASFLSDHPDFGPSFGTFGNAYFNTSTEIGRWIRDGAQTIEIIGKDMFIHGGMSRRVFGLNMSVDSINTAVAAQFGMKKRRRRGGGGGGGGAAAAAAVADTLLDTRDGLLWYRGMVPGEDASFTFGGVLAPILRYYDVERVFIGHTEVSDVLGSAAEISRDAPLAYMKLDYRVVNVNVPSDRAMFMNRGRGALVRKDGTTLGIFDSQPPNVVPRPANPIPIPPVSNNDSDSDDNRQRKNGGSSSFEHRRKRKKKKGRKDV